MPHFTRLCLEGEEYDLFACNDKFQSLQFFYIMRQECLFMFLSVANRQGLQGILRIP